MDNEALDNFLTCTECGNHVNVGVIIDGKVYHAQCYNKVRDDDYEYLES